MSQSGAVIYFITEELVDPQATLDKLVQWLGPTWLLYAVRTKDESRGWDLVQRYDRDEVASPYPETEDVCERCSPMELRNAYRSGTELKIDFSQSPKTDIFCQAHALLPVNLRGDFNPGTPIVSLGWHDLVEVDPEDEQRLLARPFLTVKVWGYGTPANDPRYRKEIWDQPFVQDFERELAALVAPHPLHHAVMFSY